MSHGSKAIPGSETRAGGPATGGNYPESKHRERQHQPVHWVSLLKHVKLGFQNIVDCLEEQFNQKALKMYNNLQQVLILASNGNDYEDNLKEILEFYNNEKSHDFNEDCLRTHLRIFSTNFPKKYCANFEDISKHFKAMAPSSRKMISEVSKIFELILVLPATNATSERTFSKLKLLKTYL